MSKDTNVHIKTVTTATITSKGEIGQIITRIIKKKGTNVTFSIHLNKNYGITEEDLREMQRVISVHLQKVDETKNEIESR